MVYNVEMVTRVSFTIKADDEVQAQDWLQTHTFEDVKELTSGYDIEYDDAVLDEAGNHTDFNIDISSDDDEERTGIIEGIKAKVTELLNDGWGIKDLLAEVYNLFQENIFTEREEGDLYNLIDPEDKYNEPATYWFTDNCGCLPLNEYVTGVLA